MTALPAWLAAMFGRHRRDSEPASVPDLPSALPEIEFEAFTEDFRIWSRVEMDRERMTDMLNASDELVLADVLVAGLNETLGTEVKELRVARADLLAVRPTGGRGPAVRRNRTRAHPVAMKIGPYLIRGYIHALPGLDPLAGLHRRRQMVPLTNARIEWESAGQTQQERMGALIVNQHAIEWIVPTVDEPVRMPYMPIGEPLGLPVKDYTGAVVS